MPRSVRKWVRSRRHWFRYYQHGVRDVLDAATGQGKPLLPPRRLVFLVGGRFEETGRQFVDFLIHRAGLRPDDSVLDVGCGAGRMAVPLTRFLSADARYEGFDSFAKGVQWCAKNISPRFPQFHFQVADLFNEFYTPRGRIRAADYRFPYADESFDMVFLASVFTHLLPEDMEHYLSEIARVLRSGGTCVITYFLLTPDALARMEEGRTDLDFRFDFGNYRSASETGKEAAVAFGEARIRQLYADRGLAISQPVERGSWSGIENSATYQDIVVATKNDRES